MDENRLVVIIIDNLRTPVFNENRKEFKNIYDKILSVNCIESEVTTSSSETTSSLQTLATGKPLKDPGPAYFMRKTGRVLNGMSLSDVQRGYNPYIKTFFHDQPEPSVAIYFPHNQGATYRHLGTFDPRQNIKHLHKIFWRGLNISSSIAVERFKLSMDLVNPRFTVIYFPVYDRYAHFLNDSQMCDIYSSQLDKDIGEICLAIEKKKQRDNTTICIISDHSSTKTEQAHIDLNNELLIHSEFDKINLLKNQYPDKVALVYGACKGQLYLEKKSNADFIEDNIKRMLEKSYIEHALLKTKEGVLLFEENSKALITFKKNRYRLTVDNGRPFNFSKDLLSELSHDHTFHQGFEKTCCENQPNAHISAYHLLSHPDSGDLLFISSLGFDFSGTVNPSQSWLMSKKYPYNHGTFYKEHTVVPIIISNPNTVNQLPEHMPMQDVRPLFKQINPKKSPKKSY